MTTPINDGGRAFPWPVPTFDTSGKQIGHSTENPGMSLRDYFAANERVDQDEEFSWPLLEHLAGKRPDGNWTSNPIAWFEWSNKWQSAVRFARADAMLAARVQSVQQPFDEAKERERFEKWYAGDNILAFDLHAFSRNPDGSYVFGTIQHAWQAWCARAKKGDGE